MSNTEAYKILAASFLTLFTQESLYSCGWYLSAMADESDATLDGRFSADDLEAIATWMRDPVGVMAAGDALSVSHADGPEIASD